VLRTAAALIAVSCTLLLALGVGVTASAAASWGPHNAGVSPHALTPSTVQHPHVLVPLTQANVVVTDLATNQSSFYSSSSVTPFFSESADECNFDGHRLCLDFGTDGGFGMDAPAGGFVPGSVYTDAPMAVGIAGAQCGQPGGTVELDQYTSQPDPSTGNDGVQTVAVQFDCTNSTFDISGTIAYNIVPTDPTAGYYVYGQQGELTGFGNDNYLVYLDGAMYYNLNANIVGMAPTPDGGGYWMVGADGGVFASGDAPFYGSTGSLHLNKPVVGMAATPDGKGYWFVASDGGIFAYGDAGFYGSTGSIHLNKPIVGMAATPDGKGYWLVASDGGVFAYGDAGFYGSTGSIHLNQPVVGLTPTPSGHGYWFVASDGGVFAYGDAGFYGSTGGMHLNEPIVGMTAAPDGNGYWFIASDGGVFNYGSAGFDGSLGGSRTTDVAGMSLGGSASPG
jgi:hypothetical protein